MKLQTMGYMSLSHAPTSIAPSNPWLGTYYSYYLWDANGNIKRRIGNRARQPEVREHYFNEENRLSAISDGLVDEEGRPIYEPGVRETVAVYLYDADGERVWKFSGIVTDAYRNERRVSRDLELDKTFYPTQHITLDNRNLYKHYFIGDERISTEVCRWDERQFTQQAHRIILLNGNEREFAEKVIKQVKHAIAHVGYEDPFEFNRGDYSHPEQEKFYYHYTHQGSVAALTDHHGELYQHLQYLPYGDVFVDKHRGSFASPYTFSAKEKDSESGYTNFGARYYSDGMMQWLSVDPMSDMRPGVSPYSYCQNNPIGRIDPSGALDDWYKTANGEIKYNEKIHSAEEMKAMGIKGTYLGKTYKEGSTYYSLFGDKEDLKTKQGKFCQKMDEALTNFMNPPKNKDPFSSEDIPEPPTDFNIGEPYNECAGVGVDNLHKYKYSGVDAYYQVYIDPSSMKGRFDFGPNEKQENKNMGYGDGYIPAGYNAYVGKTGTSRFKIVTLVFPSAESKQGFINKLKTEFPTKK